MNYSDWKRERGKLFCIFMALQVISGIFVHFQFGGKSLAVLLVSGGCAALGFWVTEQLIGLLSGVKRANFAAIVMLMSLKLLWWASLFLLARRLNSEEKIFVAVSLGCVLLAILLAALFRSGLPKITESTETRDS